MAVRRSGKPRPEAMARTWKEWRHRFLWGPEGKSFALDSREAYELLTGGLRSTKSGQTVTIDTALQVSTVLACVRAIAEGVAQSKIKFYTAGEKPTRIRSHPVLDLLTWRPNLLKGSTAFGFIETVLIHAVMTGNAVVFLNRVGSKREIREMIPLDPKAVLIEQQPDWSVKYTVGFPNGERKVIPPEAIWHLRGPSWNGAIGLDALRLAREAVGLAQATEEAHARFHKNGVKNSGVYTVADKLNPDQYKMLRDWIVKNTTGDNASSPLILDRGAQWVSQMMTGVDAQHLETRKFQVEEICRAFRVIPMMVGYSDKTATYASAEQMFIAHVVHTITPWATRFEQSAEVNLLRDDEEIDIRFDLKSLMRGAAKDRAEYYAKALGSGGSPAWMTQADVREDDGFDWIEGTDKLPEPTNVGGAVKPAGGNSNDAAV